MLSSDPPESGRPSHFTPSLGLLICPLSIIDGNISGIISTTGCTPYNKEAHVFISTDQSPSVASDTLSSGLAPVALANQDRPEADDVSVIPLAK